MARRLTNLSDSDVEKYYQLRKTTNVEEQEEQPNFSYSDSFKYQPVFGMIVAVLLIFSLI